MWEKISAISTLEKFYQILLFSQKKFTNRVCYWKNKKFQWTLNTLQCLVLIRPNHDWYWEIWQIRSTVKDGKGFCFDFEAILLAVFRLYNLQIKTNSLFSIFCCATTGCSYWKSSKVNSCSSETVNKYLTPS